MLKTNIEKYIKENRGASLFSEEREFAEKQGLIERGAVQERNAAERFKEAYIERSDKESEQMIAQEGAGFLDQPLSYLQKHKNEFIYLESEWFDLIGADSVSLEVDDLFGHYSALLGLKLQKKYGEKLKAILADELGLSSRDYSLIFDSGEGIWNFNFSLNALKDYKEDMTIGEAFSLIHNFLFKLVELA